MTASRLTVVIVDDSALYRQMLMNVLRRVEGVEVVGTAADGAEAVARVRDLRPDVITLDVAMPTMDGIAVLKALRRAGSTTRAIMVSSLTGANDPTTVEALLEGAFDHVQKPAGLEPHLAREAIRLSLAEKLQAVRAAMRHPGVAAVSADAVGGPLAWRSDLPYDAIAIGTSTGGPEALRTLIPGLPAGMPVPAFVVQHMPAMFTPTLAARLDELASARVRHAAAGMPVEPGGVYVAPGGRHLRLERTERGVACMIDDSAPRLGCRPSFDTLLESMVPIYGRRMVAVVLTGMGCDGLAGCRRLRDAGGLVIAQSPETCAVYGMPKAVVDDSLASAVLPLRAIAAALAQQPPTGGQPSTSDRTSSAT